jgi:hypothetical protein
LLTGSYSEVQGATSCNICAAGKLYFEVHMHKSFKGYLNRVKEKSILPKVQLHLRFAVTVHLVNVNCDTRKAFNKQLQILQVILNLPMK